MTPQDPPKDVPSELIREGARRIDPKDLEKVVDRAEEIKKKFALPGPLNRFVEDGRLLIELVRDYLSGKYRQLPYWTIAASAFTLIYVFNPLDIVPDVLPVVGVLDDATIVGACLMMIEQDLLHYRKWKLGR